MSILLKDRDNKPVLLLCQLKEELINFVFHLWPPDTLVAKFISHHLILSKNVLNCYVSSLPDAFVNNLGSDDVTIDD